MTEQQETGIKVLDAMITTAREGGMTVLIDTQVGEHSTVVRVDFNYVVPEYAKGTALGQSIEGDRLSVNWYKGAAKGSRWSMLDAKRWWLTDSEGVKRVKDVRARLDYMVADAAKYAAEDGAQRAQEAVTVAVATAYTAQCELHSCGGCSVECCAPVEVFTVTKGGTGGLVNACRDCIRVHGLTPTDGWSYGAQVLPGGVAAEFRQAVHPDPYDDAIREDWLTLSRPAEVEPFERYSAPAVEGWAADVMLSAHGWRAVGAWEPSERPRAYRVAVEAVSAPVSAQEEQGAPVVQAAPVVVCESTWGAESGLERSEERAAAEAERLVPVAERVALRVVEGVADRVSVEERAYVVGLVATQLRAGARSSVTDACLSLRWEGVTTVVSLVG